MSDPLQGEVIPPEGERKGPGSYVCHAFDYIKAGLDFVSRVDISMGSLLLGYFVTLFIGSYCFQRPFSLVLLNGGLFSPKIVLTLCSNSFFTAPLLVYTAQKVVFGKASGNYFSYFFQGAFWRLFFAHFVLLFFVLSPAVMVVFMMSMTLGGAAFLSNPFGGGFFVTFILIPITMLFLLSFIIRFFLINIHVPVVNRIELWPVFHLSRGYTFKILTTVLLAMLPAALLGFFFHASATAYLWFDAQTSSMVSGFEGIHLTRFTQGLVESSFMQAIFGTLVGYLNFIWMAAMAHLYVDLQENRSKNN